MGGDRPRGSEVLEGVAGPSQRERIHGPDRRGRDADRVCGDLWIRTARDRDSRRVRRAARAVAGCFTRAHRPRRRHGRPRLRPFGVRHRQHGRGDWRQAGDGRGNHQGHGEIIRHACGGNRHRQDLYAARRSLQGRRHDSLVACRRLHRGELGLLEGRGLGEVPLRRPACSRIDVAAPGKERARRGGTDERRGQLHARARQGRHPHSLRDHQRRRPTERGAALGRGLVLPARQQAHGRRGVLRVDARDCARGGGDEPDEVDRIARRFRHARSAAQSRAVGSDSEKPRARRGAEVRRSREGLCARHAEGSQAAAGNRVIRKS